MKYQHLILSLVFISLFLSQSSCLREDSTSSPVSSAAGVPPGQAGSANVIIQIGKIGMLSKSASLAPMALCSLRVILSATGETPITWVAPLSGTGPMAVSRTFTGLPEKIWSASAETRDNRNAVVHSGSMPFTIVRKQTLNVNLPLASKYSMLIAKFFPIRDSVNRCILMVDGITRGDSTFAKQALVGDTIPLRYDYLTTSATHNISMSARGVMWGFDTLLYSGDTSITVAAGVDAPFRVTLKWVGPAKPPPGQAEMFVSVGSVGTVIVQGRIGE